MGRGFRMHWLHPVSSKGKHADSYEHPSVCGVAKTRNFDRSSHGEILIIFRDLESLTFRMNI